MCRIGLLLLTLLLSACAGNERDDSARAWAIAECNRVIDKEARERCVKRAEEEYGRGKREVESARKK